MKAKPNTGEHRLTIETRGGKSVLICGHCERPFLEIENGVAVFQNKHGKASHDNRLTLEHLKMIGIEILRQLNPPQYW
jgi:hypothetical protein